MYFKSPMYYQGNKLNLLPQLVPLFPTDKKIFVDVFGGSGTVALNMSAKNQWDKVYYNEFQKPVFEMFKLLINLEVEEVEEFFSEYIVKFDLDKIRYDEEKSLRLHGRPHFIIIGKKIYHKFRDWVIDNAPLKDKKTELLLYYLVSYFSFCNSISFKNGTKFREKGVGYPIKLVKRSAGNNFPKLEKTSFGNRQYNINKLKNRYIFKNFINLNKLNYSNYSYEQVNFSYWNEKAKNDLFIYLDPPYANTKADYNDMWNLDDDKKLFEWCDNLTKQNIKWGMSNVLKHRGQVNFHIQKWAEKNNYFITKLDKKYSLAKEKASDQHSGNETVEVYISNYKPEVPQQVRLFE